MTRSYDTAVNVYDDTVVASSRCRRTNELTRQVSVELHRGTKKLVRARAAQNKERPK